MESKNCCVEVPVVLWKKLWKAEVAVFDEPPSVFQRVQPDAGHRPLNLLE
jgi:hypothetical protein